MAFKKNLPLLVSASVIFLGVNYPSISLAQYIIEQAPSIELSPFSIEGFKFEDVKNNRSSGGRRDTHWSVFVDNEDGQHKLLYYGKYNVPQFTKEKISVNYSNSEGFRGLFSWNGESGEITADVSIDVDFGTTLENGEIGASITGYIGKDKNLVLGKGKSFEHNFGYMEFDGHFDPSGRKKLHERFTLGELKFSNGKLRNIYYEPEHMGRKLVIYNFSQDSDNTDSPTYILGFIHALISNNDTFNDDNALVGAFVAKAGEEEFREDRSGSSGSRDIDYTQDEIDTLGIPSELLAKDETKIGLKRSEKTELSRDNHFSLIRHANPTFQLWGVERERRNPGVTNLNPIKIIGTYILDTTV